MMKKRVLVVLLLWSIVLQSQEINLDKYQYIIVKSKFDFLDKIDQFQTSSLTKFLLEKKGFKVYLDNENYPLEINENRCLALFASVINESSVFTTKNSIQIKDCYGKLVYQSKVGRSKIKEYKKAYQKTIRNAYETMEDFVYSYTPSSKIDETKNIVKIQDTLITSTLADESQEIKKEAFKSETSLLKFLYAKSIKNGFQLINSKPEIVFKLLKTSISDYFIIDDKNGILYKKGNNWIAEYYINDELVSQVYQIKF